MMWTAWERDNAGGSLGWRINLSQTIHHSLPSPPPPRPPRPHPFPDRPANVYTPLPSKTIIHSSPVRPHVHLTFSLYTPPQLVYPACTFLPSAFIQHTDTLLPLVHLTFSSTFTPTPHSLPSVKHAHSTPVRSLDTYPPPFSS